MSHSIKCNKPHTISLQMLMSVTQTVVDVKITAIIHLVATTAPATMDTA